MHLQQLYYFRTIAQLEHYTKAADTLMVSQPSLSHSISDLEQELGVQLFERQGRNVKLTKYGAIFLEYVTSSLNSLEDGKAKLNDFIDPNSGTIAMTFYSSLESFIPFVVAEFYQFNDNNARNVFQFNQAPHSMMEKNLLSGESDLCLCISLEHEDLRSHKVGEHNVALIVPANHPLAEKGSVDLATLRKEPFITYDNRCQIRQHIDNIFSRAGIQPEIVLETTHDTMIFNYVAAGFGVALVPQPLGMTRYNVRALTIENDLPPRDIYLCWRDVRYMSPAVQRFRDYIIGRGLLLDEFRKRLPY